MEKQNIRATIYEAINQFVTAYKQNNIEILSSEYGLDKETLAEIDDFLSFVKDKSKIILFPISDLNNGTFLSIEYVDGDYLIECILIYEDVKFYLVGEYNKTQEAQYKFEYRNFDI